MNELIQEIMLNINKKDTLWSNIDHAYCLKARIFREMGKVKESQEIITFVNKYRHPELYINGVEWFTKTIDVNIQSNLDANSKARARSWRLLKLEEAIAHREAENIQYHRIFWIRLSMN